MTDLAPVVLVIDDDASVRRALRDLFESVGLRVMVFESAREFLRTKRGRRRPVAWCSMCDCPSRVGSISSAS